MDEAESPGRVSDFRFRGNDPPQADQMFGVSWAHRNAPLHFRPKGVQRGEASLRSFVSPKIGG